MAERKEKRPPTKEECDEIQRAVSADDVTALWEFIVSGVDVNNADVYDKDGCECEPLHLASSLGHNTVIKVLHDDGGNIDIVGPAGWRPLHYAAEEKQSETVKLLMELGADINVETVDGCTPLRFALQYCSEDVVKMMIEREADIHAMDNNKETPLHWAAEWGNEAVMKFLVTKEADLNAMDKDGWRPLHYAAREGHSETVKLLVELGADVNAETNFKHTPLHLAAIYGKEAVVEFLVTKGADLNAMDENNKTPMELAVDRGHSGIVYYFFKESDMDTSQFDEETKKKISLMISQEIGQGNSNPEAMPSASTDHLSIDDVNKAYMDAEMMGSDVRIALLGAEGSGKTCLSHTLVGKTFQDTLPTEGADHMEIIVENTTNWQPITDEEKLDDLEQQKCLEAMFLSATKPAKSQQSISVAPAIAPTSSSVPVSSTSFLYPSSGSSQGSTIVSEKMPPTKKQRLSVTGVLKYAQNKKGLHISVKKFKNLKAIREQYNPTKKYINIWDFAGQAVFQHTHGMFVSEEVVCVIVFDASLGLDKKPARRYSNDRTPRRTVLQTICYWMELISSRVSKPSTSDSDLSLFLPTFILVATHIDKLDFGRYVGCDLAYENFLTVLKKELVGKPFSKHIAGSKQGQLFEKGSPSLFFICNKQLARNPTDINELKKVVIQAASITRYCRPTRYVEFERKLMLLSIQEKLYVIGLAELAEVAESCGLPTDQKELLKLAKYFHHKGSLLYFPEVPSLSDTIILSPHWLAKLLTYVLTSLTCLPIEPHLVAFARRRQKEGLLEEELIHWSVEQFNKSEAPGNRIATDLRGVPVVELFIKFQLIVDITQSSLAGSRLRGEQDRLFLVPHLLPFEELSPSVEQSFKFLFYFPAHFIPDNLVDQLIVKCAHWNHDRQYDLTKLLYQWAVLELGDYQTYQVKPNNEQCYIELTIIPDRAMPSEYEEKSYNESKELITTVKGFIDDLMKEHMAATYEKSPVECFVPCPVQTCNELHISLQNSRFVRTGSAYCCVKGDHCHLPKYAKILSSKGSPTQSTGVNTVPQKTSSLSPDQALGGDPTQSTQDNTTFEQVASPLTLDRRPKMWPLKKIVIPKIAADWKDVADCLDFDINTIRIIESKHTNDCVKSCEELLRDWLSTNHGKKPKTWTTLLETLHEIDQLATAANDIENELQELMKK